MPLINNEMKMPKLSNPHYFRRRIVMLSVSLYLISLSLPAFQTNYHHGDWYGFSVLLQGWLGMFAHNYAWFGNIFLLISNIMYLCVKSNAFKITAFCISIAALLIALSCYFYRNILVLPFHSADTPEYIRTFKIGYYFWLASFFVSTAGQLKDILISKIETCGSK